MEEEAKPSKSLASLSGEIVGAHHSAMERALEKVCEKLEAAGVDPFGPDGIYVERQLPTDCARDVLKRQSGETLYVVETRVDPETKQATVRGYVP
jgi:hypothetical protein